jgi:hypothetical protein
MLQEILRLPRPGGIAPFTRSATCGRPNTTGRGSGRANAGSRSPSSALPRTRSSRPRPPTCRESTRRQAHRAPRPRMRPSPAPPPFRSPTAACRRAVPRARRLGAKLASPLGKFQIGPVQLEDGFRTGRRASAGCTGTAWRRSRVVNRRAGPLSRRFRCRSHRRRRCCTGRRSSRQHRRAPPADAAGFAAAGPRSRATASRFRSRRARPR